MSIINSSIYNVNLIRTSTEDDFFSNAGNDNLWGLAGDDLLDGYTGDDCLFGGIDGDILLALLKETPMLVCGLLPFKI